MNSHVKNLKHKSERFSMNVWTLRGIIVMLFVASTPLVFGQSHQLETDKGIVAAIAPYDADVREAVLRASQHPEILTLLQDTQNQTASEFQKMISGFNRKKQGWFYTLTRYPDLTHALATLPAKQKQDAVYKLLPNQDPDLREAAWKLYHTENKDLVKVDDIKIAAQRNFERSIQNLNEPTKAAFQKLSTLPDVLTLMSDNVELTTRLGEQYKSDPTQLTSHLAALHDSLSVQNQYEIAALKKQLEEDPQATKEYTKAAQAYAKSNGFSSYYYGNPYSYWYGYPYWYSSPLWYPAGFGFNSGFYLGLGGGFGFYSFPTLGFSTWFFNGGYYRHYPHLYRQLGNYYHGNIAGHRVIGSANRGFMETASRHYNPNGDGRLSTPSPRSSYHRQGSHAYQNRGRNTTHLNGNISHSPSSSLFRGKGNSAGGGFHAGRVHH